MTRWKQKENRVQINDDKSENDKWDEDYDKNEYLSIEQWAS